MGPKVLTMNINILKMVLLWPKENSFELKDIFKRIPAYLIVYFSASTVISAFLRQIIFGIDDFGAVVEPIIGVSDFLCMVYMKLWLLKTMPLIKKLVFSINSFLEFCPIEVINKTEKVLQKYTIVFTFYMLGGNCINALVPLLDRSNCEKRRPNEILRQRDPCGAMARCFWPMDVSRAPWFPLVFLIQFYVCLVITMVVFGITMLVIGTLMHTIAQLQYCRKLLKEISFNYSEDIDAIVSEVNFCLKYHIKIIQ